MIIYDIDTLGERLHHQGAQTGVFRVVETIAEGIAQDPMLQPVWHAEQFHDPAKAYLQANAKLRGFPMLATEKKPSHFYTSLYNHLTQLQANDSRHPENQARLVPKAYRKVLSVARRVLTPSPPQRTLHTNPALLANSRIYHATWWKPPTHIRNHRHLTFFYTIYDLIPMLYPQYVGHNADYPSKRMMEDMDEQSWGLSISQSSKNDLCNYNQRINPDKVVVTPLAADRRIFYPEKKEETLAAVRKKYGVPDAPYLLSLSTLAPHKNIIHVIQSFFKLLEQQHIKDLN